MEIGIFIVGLLAGVMSGMFGVGGGIVMVPTLIAFLWSDMVAYTIGVGAAWAMESGINQSK